VAEHTWRLSLMALAFEDRLGPVDFARVLKLCVIHDLGEAISGDVPAVQQQTRPDKSEQERRDLQTLTESLPGPLRAAILALWDDYEHARSREAGIVRALDKLETIIQHNQGANPPGFDYAFNLEYGRQRTAIDPLFEEVRALVDEDTRRNAARPGTPGETT
jgi:putative hydrolase of HD superfamily